VFAVSKVIRMSKDARDQGGDIGVKMGLWQCVLRVYRSVQKIIGILGRNKNYWRINGCKASSR
jgi:hypothetical protein